MKKQTQLIPVPDIAGLIYCVRGQRVILDTALAQLYGVETFRFNEAVKRNRARFPGDFIFRLSDNEWRGLKSLRSQSATLDPGLTGEEGQALTSQIAMSKTRRGGRRTL